MSAPRWEMPMPERLALLEAEHANIRTAVVEIKDAVVSINATLNQVARLEERYVGLAEASQDLRRSLECERANRAAADKDLDDRIRQLEQPVHANTDRLAMAGAWLTRIGTGSILILIGVLAGKFIGG